MIYALITAMLLIDFAGTLFIWSVGTSMQVVNWTAGAAYISVAFNIVAAGTAGWFLRRRKRKVYAVISAALVIPIHLLLIFFPVIPVLAEYSGPSQIRVRNASARDLQNVEVGGKVFGDINSGAVSEYQRFEIAYGYAPFKLRSGGKPVDYVIFDYAGEKPLGRGRFSYVISPDSTGTLPIRAEKDQ